MVDAREVDDLEGEQLLVEVVWLVEGDDEPDASEGHGYLPQHDPMNGTLLGSRLLQGMPILSRVLA
jgi:hypothetical protein